MEECEIYDLDEVETDKIDTQFFKMIKEKKSLGYKVSLMFKKTFSFTKKKNNFFSTRPWDSSDTDCKDHTDDEVQKKLMTFRTESNVSKACESQEKEDQKEAKDVANNLNFFPEYHRDHSQKQQISHQRSVGYFKTQQQQVDQTTSIKFCSYENVNTNLFTNQQEEEEPLKIVRDQVLQTQNSVDSEKQEESKKSSTQRHDNNSEQQKDLLKPQESPKKRESIMQFFKEDDNEMELNLFRNDEFYQKLKSTQHHSIIQRGLTIFQQGQILEAKDIFTQAVKELNFFIKKKQQIGADVKPDMINSLQAHCYLGQIHRYAGQYQDAISQLEHCLRLFEINDIDVLAKIYMELGYNYLHQHQLKRSLDYLFKALHLYEKVHWKLDIARVLSKIGYLLSLLNCIKEAKEVCYTGLALYKSKLSSDDIRIQEVYHILGRIFYQAQEYEFAEQYLHWSLDGKKQIYGDNHPSLIITLNLLGILAHTRGNINKAIDYYEKAVLIYGTFDHIGLAQVLNNLGLAYLDRFKIKSSALCFIKAIEILSVFFKPKDPRIIRIQRNQNLIEELTSMGI